MKAQKPSKKEFSIDDLDLDDNYFTEEEKGSGVKTEIEKNSLDVAETDPNSNTEQKFQIEVDVYETEKSFVVIALVPHLNVENLIIDVASDSLEISFEVLSPQIDGEILAQEIKWGEYTRSVIFPSEIDVERSSAEINGYSLIIRLPKLIRTPQKRITPRISSIV